MRGKLETKLIGHYTIVQVMESHGYIIKHKYSTILKMWY